MISNPQWRLLHGEAAKAGLTHEHLKAVALKQWGLESLREMSARQYEQMLVWIKQHGKRGDGETGKRGKGNVKGDGPTATNRAPRLKSLEDVQALIDSTWPELHAETRADLALVFDDVRMCKKGNAVSSKVVTEAIERLKRFEYRVIKRATQTWLERYRVTGKPPEYFIGICRKLVDADRAEGRFGQTDQQEPLKVQRARVQLAQWLSALGFHPESPPAQVCLLCNGTGAFSRPVEFAPGRVFETRILCPACKPGRDKALACALNGDSLIDTFPPEWYDQPAPEPDVKVDELTKTSLRTRVRNMAHQMRMN